MGVVEIVLVMVAVVLVVLVLAVKAIKVIPQAQAQNVERLGQYSRTLQSGLNFVVPGLERVKPRIDLRERVATVSDQRVITADNLKVRIDTVLFYQVHDPKAADYEIVNYPTAIELLTATMLRSVIGGIELQKALSSREEINAKLRGELDDASGKWGIRVTRVEIRELDPEPDIMDAMQKPYRAQRQRSAAVTVAEGQASAIEKVFKAIHEGKPDPELLAYYFVQQMPRVAQSQGSTVWMIPNELTTALRVLSSAFGNSHGGSGADAVPVAPDVPPLGPRALPTVVEGQSAGDGGPAAGKPDDSAQPGTEGPAKAA